MGSLSLTFVAAFPTFTAAHFSLIPSVRGAVAQLGERLNGIQEVEGSIPFGSTNRYIVKELPRPGVFALGWRSSHCHRQSVSQLRR